MTDSNANMSGLETAGHVVWWKVGGVNYYPEGEAFTVSESYRVEPLVTAASAQAMIDAAEARADRLAKALEPFGEGARMAEISGRPPSEFCDASDYQAALAALQQEIQS